MRTPIAKYGMLALLMMALYPGSVPTGACAQARRYSSDVTERGGAYFTGVYPNLFADLLGTSRAVVRARVDSIFHQLFYGNDQSERVYYPSGSDMSYIEDIGNNDVRTE